MNTLYVGLRNDIELPDANFLYLNGTVPTFPQARLFDPFEHQFNPLRKLDYLKECTIVEIFDALFDPESTTLTKSSGLDYIAEALQTKPRFLYDLVPKPDKKSTTGHVWAYSKVQKILRSPVLRKVLCSPPNFSFNKRSVILARINRSELGRFDALVLGLFIMAEFKGQIVVPNFGFYARPFHADLIEEERIICSVRTLSQIKDATLRDECLLIEEKIGAHTTVSDAKTLMDYEGTPDNEREQRMMELIR